MKKVSFLYLVIILFCSLTNLSCMDFNIFQNLVDILDALNKIEYSINSKENLNIEIEAVDLILKRSQEPDLKYKVKCIEIIPKKYIAVYKNTDEDENNLKNEYLWSKNDEIVFRASENYSHKCYLASNTMLLIISSADYWTFIWKIDNQAHAIAYNSSTKKIMNIASYGFSNDEFLPIHTDQTCF